ncbi:MAG TPA: tetratricopeptide repeat protein [Gallionellaceae bacterium]|nr:tetratricopeptide repeat protein [Gallionellaceae bacterium]
MRREQNFSAVITFHRTKLFSATLLLCAVCITYANSFWGAFQFDDFNVIVNNPRIHSWSAWWQDLQHGIRPLLKFTYTADWAIGLGVAGFHLTNVLIHLGNTWLVWLLARRFVANHPALNAQSVLPLSVPFLAALLFAVHPAHSEAVTYICGRSSALMTLFYLAGMLLYVEGKAQGNKIYLHLLTPLCMLLALGVKETAVTYPFALLLWELHSGGSLKSAWRKQWSSWLLLAAGALFFLLHDGYLAQMETSAALNSLQGNLATQTMAFAWLLRQWLFPLWLNIDSDLPVLHDFAGLLPHFAVLAIFILLIILSFMKRPWLSFALAWALLQLFPLYLFLPRIDVANERQLYLVSWPLALALAAELSLLLTPKIFRLSIALLLVALASLTVLRNQDYRSEISLWEATVQRSPDKARVQNNLGYAYMHAGRAEEAQTAFTIALQLDPNYYQARYNLLRLRQETVDHKI